MTLRLLGKEKGYNMRRGELSCEKIRCRGKGVHASIISGDYHQRYIYLYFKIWFKYAEDF